MDNETERRQRHDTRSHGHRSSLPDSDVRQLDGEVFYGTNSRPPYQVLALNGLQHASLIMLSLVSSVIVLKECGLDTDAIRTQLGLILIGIAIMNLVISFRVGPFGAGLLLPVNMSAVFLVPALIAARQGGLPMVSGMIIFSGVLMIVFANLLPRLRPFFPTEIAGLVILIIGLDISMIGQTYIINADGAAADLTASAYLVSFVTLAVFTIVAVWIGGRPSDYAVLLAVLAGVGLFSVLKMFGLTQSEFDMGVPFFALPVPQDVGLAFDPALVLIYAVTTLGVTLHLLGNITNVQQMSDPNWVRPNMRSLVGGTVSAGLGLVILGLFGGHGAAVNSASLGLARANRVISLRVAVAIAIVLVLGGLSPLLIELVLSIPQSVTGPIWLVLGAYVIIGGIRILTSRALDTRKSLIIGLSMPIGLSAKVYPEVYATLPTLLQPLTSSTLVLGTVSAVLLNALFRLGISQSATLVLTREDNGRERIETFLGRQGGLWGARVSVIEKVTFSLVQLNELIREHRPDASDISIRVEFDEYNLRATVLYDGKPLVFPTKRPAPRDIITRDDGTERLAGYLVRSSADGLEAVEEDGHTTLNIRFEH